jgi:hypothetical protein
MEDPEGAENVPGQSANQGPPAGHPGARKSGSPTDQRQPDDQRQAAFVGDDNRSTEADAAPLFGGPVAGILNPDRLEGEVEAGARHAP